MMVMVIWIATFISLVDVGSFGLVDDLSAAIGQFLSSNNISMEEIDLVLYSSIDQRRTKELKTVFENRQLFDYQKIAGTYFTNAAFAMHYAIDILGHKKHPVFGKGVRKVLVCNNLIPENLDTPSK